MRPHFSLLAALGFVLSSCGSDASAPVAAQTDRPRGTRAPRHLECDPMDSTRCALPWPSNTFTVADPSSPTGLRLRLGGANIGRGDDATGANRADGFPRASPVLTGLPTGLDARTLGDGPSGALRVIVAQPGDHFGEEVPMRIAATGDPEEDAESFVVGYPRVPYRAATDYACVLMDSVRGSRGQTFNPDPLSRVALGLRAPATESEEALRAYHAPARAALRTANIDPSHVLRVWDFTSRSAESPARALRAMRESLRAAVFNGEVRVSIEGVELPTSGNVLVRVLGHLRGLPNFVTGQRVLHRDALGEPVALSGTRFDAPFRVVIPRGEGSYRVVMYGHGTGGDVTDAAFDPEITGAGAAKVSMEFQGWTGRDVVETFLGTARLLQGIERSSAVLMQSLAGGTAILAALQGDGAGRGAVLADALSGRTLGDVQNPAAGRRPDASLAVWAGGSLGGTAGMVFSIVEPGIVAGVLNVPGAAWSHMITHSETFNIVRLGLRTVYGSDSDIELAVAQSQVHWDDVDGAAWADLQPGPRAFLLQESIGDPVLPNVGTEFAAAALGALQVGAVLVPVAGLSHAEEALGRPALTQFRVPRGTTAALDVHGFAARDSLAGRAARQQIEAFIRSVWSQGATITVPQLCVMNTPAGSCDFSAR